MTTPAELKQAVERLRRNFSGEDNDVVWSESDYDEFWIPDEKMNDLKTVAKAYLAQTVDNDGVASLKSDLASARRCQAEAEAELETVKGENTRLQEVASEAESRVHFCPTCKMYCKECECWEKRIAELEAENARLRNTP